LLGSAITEARFQNMKKMLPAGLHKQFKDYGCHCWRKNDQGKRQVGFGPGIPIMDPIDQACHDLGVCYENALVEFGVDGNARYKWSREDDRIDCSGNKHPGKAAVCGCDGEFVAKIMGNSLSEVDDRRRTGKANFGHPWRLLNVVDINHWGNKRNLKQNNIDWNAKETCVFNNPEADDLFCNSRHVQDCLTRCGGCFTIRELGGCLDEPSGCGTCDGCSFSGWDEERCLDAERCWSDEHCNNGRRDASEQGIDCGGSCPKSCAETGDLTPFCELIRDDGVCGENCLYAFSDTKFINADPPIMPQSLVIDICTTPEGKYTSICPQQCACENQSNQHLCERGGLCTWEPDTSEPEWSHSFKGICIEPESANLTEN